MTTVRFELDERSERAVARLRGIAGILVAGGAAWLLALAPPASTAALAILGLLAGLGLLASGLRGRRRSAERARWYLELDGHGLTLAEGLRYEHRDWAQIRAVEVDEDRLVVVLESDESPTLRLEPRYANQSVYALCDIVHDRWRAARNGSDD